MHICALRDDKSNVYLMLGMIETLSTVCRRSACAKMHCDLNSGSHTPYDRAVCLEVEV